MLDFYMCNIYNLNRGKLNTDEKKTNLAILAATDEQLLTIYNFKMVVGRILELVWRRDESGRIEDTCKRFGGD